MSDAATHPLVLAAIRVLAVVFAALVVAVGFFDRSLAYALAVGLILGVGYAVVEYVRGRLGDGRTGHA
ncbi:hypothetical protein HWV07_17405 [Natronomonas salina]|uniref:hypothetical protein n=1 Tax=Natronomonas salina TaxID=1710540 RepID=UPI0015B768F4|nr:hypothetical protein [Natronomonas salina]QLD90724.1 hypothetical protein HWV07_17405 [Natronomonas salina]